MTIFFSNKGEIDLDTIRTMGVHVKSNDSAIGYFGTGMKFAIATLLRNNHRVVLIRGNEHIEFTARPKTIRGKEFMMVYMEEEQLAFTTDLGKNWLVWQAYRELYSNCIDEAGSIKRTPVEGSDTIWSVTGEEIEKCHDDRGKIFLQSEAQWMAADGVEVHRGKSKFLYYRGVRVYELPKEAMFTYNFLMPMVLTEDRTLSSLYDAIYKLGTRLPTIADPEFCTKLLNPKIEKWEDSVSLEHCVRPSEEFLDALEKVCDDVKDEDVRRMIKKHRPGESTRVPMSLTEPMVQDIDTALEMLKGLRVNITPQEIMFTQNLGQNVHGLLEDGKIYISEICLNKGADWIASTIYEEWIHLHLGYADGSRGLQQFLFDKVFELLKQVKND